MEHSYNSLPPSNLLPVYSTNSILKSQQNKLKQTTPQLQNIHTQIPIVNKPDTGCQYSGSLIHNPLNRQFVACTQRRRYITGLEQELDDYKLELETLQQSKTPKAYRRTTRRALEKKLVELERRLIDL